MFVNEMKDAIRTVEVLEHPQGGVIHCSKPAQVLGKLELSMPLLTSHVSSS